MQNKYLNYLIYPSFQGVNILFVLFFENKTDREIYRGHYLPKIETKDYHVMTNVRDFFDQPIKNDQITYDNIQKRPTDQGDDYSTGCLQDYLYFKEHYKLIPIGLSKQHKFDADPNAIQKISFTGNLENNTKMFMEEAKKTALGFSKRILKVLWLYFVSIYY